MRTAVITGVSRGLGRALLHRATTGCDAVIAIGRRWPEGEAPAKNQYLIEAELSEEQDWDGIFGELEALGAASEILFFDNAAIHDVRTLAAPGLLTRLAETLAVNVETPAAIASALVRLAEKRGAKLKIVHVTTGAARRPIEGWGQYCTSKAAAAMLFEVLALEHPEVDVHLADPGVVDTDMQAQIRQGPAVASRDYFVDLKEQGNLVTPETAAIRLFALVDG